MQVEKTSVKKNFAYQMTYEVLIIILPFVTSPYIARVIGAEGLGIYSFTYSVAYYFVLASMLGLKNYGNRAVAKTRNNKDVLNETFSSILFLHIIISVVCSIAYLIYASTRTEDQIYAFIQFFYVLSALFDISWFYFGIEKFKLTVARNIVIKLINITCVFAFVRSKEDLWIYCLIMSLGFLASQLSLWIPLKKYVKIVKTDFSAMLPHLKPLIILFIPAIAVSLYKYMDKIMIGSMSSKMQLGFYENAEKVINIPLTIIVSFGTVMLPKMSNLSAGDNTKESRKYIALSMQYVMCLAFALSFGIGGIGQIFAPVFWGKSFEPSGIIIMGLAITIPFISFADVVRTQYLIPNERDKDYLLSVISGAGVNLVINYLLIPQFGANGAMIGTIVAEMTVCILQGLSVRKELPLIEYIKSFIVFLLIGTVMFICVYYLGKLCGTHFWTLFIQVFVGVFIYGVFTFAYFYITKNVLFMSAFSHVMKTILKK